MLKLFLVVLAVSIASAKVGLNVGSYTIARNTANCIGQQNISRVAIELLNGQGTYNTGFISYFINLKDANVTDIDAIVKVNDSWDAEKVCTNITRALPQAFNGTVWLNVDTGSWNKKSEKE